MLCGECLCRLRASLLETFRPRLTRSFPLRSGTSQFRYALDVPLVSSRVIPLSDRQPIVRRLLSIRKPARSSSSFAVDKSEDDLPWLPQFSEMPDDLAHYPTFSFRSGAYFEKSCKLSEVSSIRSTLILARGAAEPLPEQIIEDILLELYAGKRREDTEHSLKRYNKQLDDWRATLHADLVIAENAAVSPPPNCVTLK
jgi:hypothetical protein